MSDQITVHAALARALQDQGVETLFGLMGDSNLFMVDHYVRELGGHYVPAAHEAGAVLMALGHAAMTRKIGVATVTQGPALTNTITALIEGRKSTLPMVLLAGDTDPTDPDHPQTMPQRQLIEAADVGFVQLRSPGTVAQDVATAFRRAWVERRPVVLNMPTPFMWEMTDYTPSPRPLPDTPAAPEMGPALEEAIGIIAAARSPVILGGRGAIGKADALLRLAERIGAPVATTLKAKGLFNGAPYDLGVFGTLSTPAASEVIAAADVVISFGAGINRFTTYKGAFLKDARLVQIDEDPGFIGMRETPDAAVVGDCGLVADAFVHWLDEAEVPSSQSTDRIDPAALREPHARPKPGNRPGTIDFSVALERIDAALPADRVFVSDAGRFLGDAWARINVSAPENMLLTIGVGAIGMGMGHAVGAAVARPDQTTLFVTGDGGFMLGGLGEFSAVTRENLNIVTVVCNDSAYGAEYIQFERRQMDPGMSQFNWPSFADVTGAMGAQTYRVTTEAELDAALAAIPDATAPVVIELMLDPAAMPPLHL